MRGALLIIWLLLPVALGAYHYGPGQQRMELDRTAGALSAARRAVAAGDHVAAVKSFDTALASLPTERVAEARQIRLERAKSHLLSSQLPAAYNELDVLVTELEGDPAADPALLADARTTQASAKYYVTWLMRLEGRPREEWEPEIESARQTYRLLAEEAATKDDAELEQTRQDDLEAAVRLARMDLSELEALPLPSQCKNCKSGQCNCKCKGKGKKKSPNNSKKKEDARGASSGPPPDGSGN